ncbi:MAG: hypothetical protein ACQESR_23995 [Planctomycetota bacterium]
MSVNEFDDVLGCETVDHAKVDHEARTVVFDFGTGEQVKSGNFAATHVLPFILPFETFVERFEFVQRVDRATSNHGRLAILKIAALSHDDNSPDVDRDLRRWIILHIKQCFEDWDPDVDKQISLGQPFRRLNLIKYEVNPWPRSPWGNESVHHLILGIVFHWPHPDSH